MPDGLKANLGLRSQESEENKSSPQQAAGYPKVKIFLLILEVTLEQAAGNSHFKGQMVMMEAYRDIYQKIVLDRHKYIHRIPAFVKTNVSLHQT